MDGTNFTDPKQIVCQTNSQLQGKRCLPCEGGIPKYSLEQATLQLATLPGWSLTHDGERIRRDWRAKNFLAGMNFLNAVAELAESEAHHPDVHLWGYRQLWIEIWTHAINGLSENDFILAAKIDQLATQHQLKS
jgi:4a-hydroxytetrahydrobiopterin dehydratase